MQWFPSSFREFHGPWPWSKVKWRFSVRPSDWGTVLQSDKTLQEPSKLPRMDARPEGVAWGPRDSEASAQPGALQLRYLGWDQRAWYMWWVPLWVRDLLNQLTRQIYLVHLWMIFPLKPPFIGDFPASHVWWNQRVHTHIFIIFGQCFDLCVVQDLSGPGHL